MNRMPPVLVRDGVRRNGFLATIGSRTWRPRAVAACALADLEAVSSRSAYAAWLARVAPAWERLPVFGGRRGNWPLVCVGPECLRGHALLLADLADVAPGDLADLAPGDLADLAPGDLTGADLTGADLTTSVAGTDEAFLVGAAYVAVDAACDAAVLTAAALSLAAEDPRSVGTRFLRECRLIAGARTAIRRELTAWATDQDPPSVERAVLAARALSLELAEALRP